MYGKRRSQGNKLLGSVEESFPCGLNISYQALRGCVLFFWSGGADRKGREVGYGRTGMFISVFVLTAGGAYMIVW